MHWGAQTGRAAVVEKPKIVLVRGMSMTPRLPGWGWGLPQARLGWPGLASNRGKPLGWGMGK